MDRNQGELNEERVHFFVESWDLKFKLPNTMLYSKFGIMGVMHLCGNYYTT